MRLRFSIGIILCFVGHILTAQEKQVHVDGAILSYTEKGAGQPMVFIHGNFEDYRMWEREMELLSDSYHIIAYSRRLNYPNQNSATLVNYSAESEADDLAALITKLQLAPVHLAGHSFGGLVAIVFAAKYPQLTRSLILSDPLLIDMLDKAEDGRDAYENYYNYFVRPVKIAFDLRDTADVLRHTLTYLHGDNITDQLSAEQKQRFISNFGEVKALVNSQNALTKVTGEEIKYLKVPVMLISTGSPLKALRIMNRELKETLPRVSYIELPGASYDVWQTHAEQLSGSIKDFITTMR